MPYDPTTGIISGAVGIHDVAKAIGAGKNVELRDHPNINKWAKNKPFRASFVREATPQDRIDANYGMNFTVTEGEVGTDVVSAVKRAAQDANNFAYDTSGSHAQGKPRGVAYNEFFRLTDFSGYRHNAPAPIQPLERTDINRFLYGSTIQLELYSTDIEQSDYQISLQDVINGVRANSGVDLSSWYIIVAVEYSSTKRFWGISQETIDNPSRRFRIDFDKTLLTDGTPNFYIAAISDRAASSGSKVTGLPFLRVDTGYGYGVFNVHTDVPFNFQWQRVYTSNVGSLPPDSWDNMDVDLYRARAYQFHDGAPEPDIFLQMSTDCDMCYGFKIENITDYSAPLQLSRLTLQSGLSVAASGWPSAGPNQYPTGRRPISTAYYATSKIGGWSAFPSSGQINIEAHRTVYVFFALYQFQRYYNGSLGTAISGQSSRGAQLTLFMDDVEIRNITSEERWERDAIINIKK